MGDGFAVSGGAPGERRAAATKRWAIGLLSSVVFLYWVTLYLYMPTLPVYVEGKANDLAMVGVVLSMYGLWQALARVPVGMAADWVGLRKPFMCVGMLLAAVGAVAMALAGDVQALMLGRIITGLAAATWVPLVVSFTALFPPADAVRATTVITFIGTIGRLVATSVTGVLNDAGGYELAFFVAAAAAVLGAALALPVPEVRRPSVRPSGGALLALIGRRDVLLPTLLAVLSQYVSWATSFGFVPIIADRFGATPIQQSLLMTANIAGLAVGTLGATAALRRFGAKPLVAASFVIVAVSTAFLALPAGLGLLLIVQTALGLAHGVGYPVLMGLSIRYVGGAERTTAMGLHQAIYALGMFAGPALSGVLAEAMGLGPMFVLTAVLCVLLGVGGSRMLRRNGDAESA